MGNICFKIEENPLKMQIPNENSQNQNQYNSNKEDYSSKQKKAITIDDFKNLGKLGKGSYGKVFLVERKIDNKQFALKRIEKQMLQNRDIRLKDIKNEKEIMLKAQNPFIIKLHFTFQDEFYLYYGMDYIEGGVLINYIKEAKGFPEKTAKFFAAQVLMALRYLHNDLKIIYRDLKPENILIDSQGYVKLTDFGLSTFSDQETKSICGTMEYIAPEVFKGSYGHQVDYWALGVLIFEMIFSIPPFRSNKIEYLPKMITDGRIRFPTSPQISQECKDIILKLLKKKEERLGYKDIQQIFDHPWFADIDFDRLYKKEYTSIINIRKLSFGNEGIQVNVSEDKRVGYDVQGFTYVGQTVGNSNNNQFILTQYQKINKYIKKLQSNYSNVLKKVLQYII